MQNQYSAIKCVVLESDNQSLEIIQSYIAKVPFLQFEKSFSNPFEAVKFLNNNKIDLVFACTEMQGVNTISLFNCLNNRPLIVYFSDSEKYACEAFNCDAIDYLLKPVTFERLFKSALKAQTLLFKNTDTLTVTESQQVTHGSIFVKADYKILKLKLENILFIEGFNDYVKIHTLDSRPILSLVSLRELEDKLPVNEFLRVHRSYIVSLSKIDCIEKKRIAIGKHFIPISQSYNDAFFEIIEKMNFCFY